MKPLLYFSFILLTFSSIGQTVVTGVVTDKNGPVVGASVYIENSYDGATTGIDGNFSFQTSRIGHDVLIVSFIGYLAYSEDIELASSIYKKIELRPSLNELEAVTISAGSFTASDEVKKVIMKSVDIVTTAGATADIAGALNTLPGTQTVGESGRLFVRGGAGHETRTFIDGMLVHNEYAPSAPNTPNRSRFSPFIFKGTSFSTGGYSAEYGQALSSALILDSKDVAEMERTDLSIMSVGMEAARTEVWENASFTGKIGYTNLSPYFKLTPPRIQWEEAPHEWAGNLAFRKKIGSTGILKVFGNLTRAGLKLYQRDIINPSYQRPVGLNNHYGHANIVYRDTFRDRWGYKVGLATTTNNENAYQGADNIQSKIGGSHAKMVLYHFPDDRVTIQAGSEIIRTHHHQKLTSDDRIGSFTSSFTEEVISAHLELEIFLSEKFAFRLGSRWENNLLNNNLLTVPRLSISRKLGSNDQFSLAYGIFYQSAQNKYLLENPILDSEKANHYIANYQWEHDNKTFRIELYQKEYDQLVKENINSWNNSGNGFARGLDIWWRDADSFEGLDYWISYSFLKTEREYLDFPGKYTPSFASAHNISFVLKKWIQSIKSQIGATYSFGSPRTYTDPNEDGYLQARTPVFQDLSVNVSYLMNSQVIFHAMVNNIPGFENVFGYEYASQPDNQGFYASRAIRPSSRRFVFLGVFITLSKDKTINQLPNL